jgi:hypothetical protein
MGRTILGVIAGIVAAVAVIWGVEMLNHIIHPLPASLDINKREELGAYVTALPPLALALIAAAWFLGALVGGLVGAAVARRDTVIFIVGFIVLLAAVANILMIRHPAGLMFAAVAAPLLGAVAARMIHRRRRRVG